MNLSRQYEQHKDEFLAAIQAVCEKTAFSAGPFVKQFEEEFAEYTKTKAAAGVNNGTTALQLALTALGVSTGDEVIIPANTFIATAWAAVYVGATPVFVDCTPDTWNIDPKQIEKAITSKTKAITGVHLYGQPFDVDAVKEIAKKHNLCLIEDCAQAHGAVYKGQVIGGLSDMGCFSFYPGKNLGAYGEAGAVVSQSEEYIEHIQRLKNHGQSQQYHHDEVGFNMRMEGIQAAILSCKLKYIAEWTKRRQAIAEEYFKDIKNSKVKMTKLMENVESVHHLFVVKVDNREKFLSFMKDKDILCGQHYPIPCHLQKAFAHLGYKKGDLPNAEDLAAHCVSLPMFPELKDEELAAVIKAVNEY